MLGRAGLDPGRGCRLGLADLEYREILQLKIASVCPDQVVGKVAKMS